MAQVARQAGAADRIVQLGDGLRLLDQRQQDVFGIDLIMAEALYDFRSALGGLLCSLGKAIKSHHNLLAFLRLF